MSSAVDYLIAARRGEVDELETLARTCDLVICASELIHRLQGERGASNIFLASGGTRFAALREQRVADSDAAQSAVCDWLERTDTRHGLCGGARLYTRVAVALHALDGLPAIRADVSRGTFTPGDASKCYSEVIAALLALVFEAADVAVDPLVSRWLIALFHLMHGKELAGQERALGAAAYAAGQFDATQARALDYLIEMQEQALERFCAFAEELRDEWAALQTTLPLGELERLRRKLLASAARPLDADLADAWFACCSTRMDALHGVETHLAQRLQAICAEQTARRRDELDDQQRLLAALAAAHSASPALTALATRIEAASTGGASVGPQLTQTVVDMVHAQAQRLQSVTDELAELRAALDERKLVERAKGLLMAHRGLSEDAAYRLLRQNAMNQNRRLVDVAQAVLSLAEILPPSR